MKLESAQWGRARDGGEAVLITITNNRGAALELSNYGGILRALYMPGRSGHLENVVLGYETLAEYEADPYYLGAMIGRYANRIRGGRLALDGRTYSLAQNEGQNHLHGGPLGFSKKRWDYSADGPGGVMLFLVSPDGEAGFPGRLEVTIRVALTEENAVELTYTAKADADTYVNLTNHSYFNLGERSATDHQLCLSADFYTPVDDALLPTGELAGVAGGPFDFRSPRRIGSHYDHNFVLRQGETGPAARLGAPTSGRTMSVYTDMPGVQLYTGGSLGVPFSPGAALCLETQYFPDAPNQPGFPSPLLRAGDIWRHTTRFVFEA